jgi:hypothetical protein
MTNKFIVIGFYTDNYKDSAQHFASSCVAHGVPFYLQRIDDQGGWHKNTSYKPKFILECMDRFNCDVVYVDVDAEFLKFPTLFDTIQADIAFFKGSVWNDSRIEVLSGTMYFSNNDMVWLFVEAWEHLCKTQTDWDQVLIEPCITEDLKIEYLPIEYCAIFDSPRVVGKDIVIRHLQHSRTKKR